MTIEVTIGSYADFFSYDKNLETGEVHIEVMGKKISESEFLRDFPDIGNMLGQMESMVKIKA
jgi:hypothetical protein